MIKFVSYLINIFLDPIFYHGNVTWTEFYTSWTDYA